MEHKSCIVVLKVMGIILLVVSLIYLILGTLTLTGTVKDILPGHEKGEVLVVVLSYATAVFSLFSGIVCLKNAVSTVATCGLILAIIATASQIYCQIATGSFYCFDIIPLCIGLEMFACAKAELKQ